MGDKKPPRDAKELLQRYAEGERDFGGFRREGATLAGAHLSGADLRGSNFTSANLKRAHLEGAKLESADFLGTNLVGAHLEKAELARAKLISTILAGANLLDAKLNEVSGYKTRLNAAKLIGAVLIKAQLNESDFRLANLEGANLKFANLSESNLVRANLKGANLVRAVLERADLSGANLEQTDLSKTYLWGAYYDESTRFPDDFDPFEHRMGLIRRSTETHTKFEERKYRPYSVDLVNELEKLTRERARPIDGDTPKAKQERQARIDQLCAQLKSISSPRIGNVIVGSRLVRIIGKGNFGTVWQATDEESGEPRAVKVFDSDRLGLGLALYHFRRGVRAMEHLNQIDGRPSTVVKLYQVDEAQLAFSMKYVDNGDLTEHKHAGWDIEKKVSIFKTLCDAVRFAHRNKVLHRDIKPANVVMARSGEPILTDFDIADLLFVKTQSAQAAGTILYAAPEQLGGKARRDATGDIYSLGRILHFLLLEKDPDIVFEEVQKLEDLKGKPDVLVRIIRKCTLRDPGKRYQTVDELLFDLNIYESKPDFVGVDLAGPNTSLSPKEKPVPKRKPVSVQMQVAFIGGLFTIIAALITGYFTLLGSRREPDPKPKQGILPAADNNPEPATQPSKRNPDQSKQAEISRLRGILYDKAACERPPCNLRAQTSERAAAAVQLVELSGNKPADLKNADLFGANLSGANLAGADLYKANLGDANLAGADLSGANLSGANLKGTKYDSKTEFPDGFDLTNHEMKYTK